MSRKRENPAFYVRECAQGGRGPQCAAGPPEKREGQIGLVLPPHPRLSGPPRRSRSPGQWAGFLVRPDPRPPGHPPSIRPRAQIPHSTKPTAANILESRDSSARIVLLVGTTPRANGQSRLEKARQSGTRVRSSASTPQLSRTSFEPLPRCPAFFLSHPSTADSRD